jgi:hypothetical protein
MQDGHLERSEVVEFGEVRPRSGQHVAEEASDQAEEKLNEALP